MPKGGKPARMNRGVSEAAEALLGMGIGEMMDEDESLVRYPSCNLKAVVCGCFAWVAGLGCRLLQQPLAAAQAVNPLKAGFG